MFIFLQLIVESAHSCLGDNEMFLLGDLNCDFTQDVQSSILSRLKFITGSFNLVQLIDTPTRITDKSSTIIDTVFTLQILKM